MRRPHHGFGSLPPVEAAESALTSVGAILLFFGWPPSSSSLSLTSRLAAEGTEAVFRGVSGGVVMGTPVTLPECVAVRPGTWPTINDGFVIIPA